MAVTPPISGFFGLDPRFLAAPAASSSLINPLLFGSSFQMVPINFGGFNSGIPPIFGGTGFTGFPTVPFNMFSQPSVLASPFSGSGAFGSGFGTSPFGSNVPQGGGFTFGQGSVNPLNNTPIFTPGGSSGGGSNTNININMMSTLSMMMAQMFGYRGFIA